MESFESTFNRLESNVRSYGRSFSTVFEKADGCFLIDKSGKKYYDFLSGAGSLNYGHNNPALKADLIEYISGGGISHSLDFYTTSKQAFLEDFNSVILKPRGFNYKLQFTGPTGANAVEAALKLARMVTGRTDVVAFTNGFHGVTLAALAVTGNKDKRACAGVSLNNVTRMPYENYMPGLDSLDYLEKTLLDASSGIELPAAVIVETIQGEGGLNSCSSLWLKRLESLCRKHNILLIVDDIQAGCGRGGDFFSFEHAGIKPDIVTLSKSISGYGLPMAVVLLKPELDIWKPGEHNGTFRGNNLAFVTARSAINNYWKSPDFEQDVRVKAQLLQKRLEKISNRYAAGVANVKGRCFMTGIELANGSLAQAVSALAFEQGMVIETSGSDDEVIKCLAPLTISAKELKEGLDILSFCIEQVLSNDKTVALHK